MSQNQKLKGKDCKRCNQSNTVHMVQCDNLSCNKWYHFACVGVDSSIADKAWMCEECVTARGNTPGNNISDIHSPESIIVGTTSQPQTEIVNNQLSGDGSSSTPVVERSSNGDELLKSKGANAQTDGGGERDEQDTNEQSINSSSFTDDTIVHTRNQDANKPSTGHGATGSKRSSNRSSKHGSNHSSSSSIALKRQELMMQAIEERRKLTEERFKEAERKNEERQRRAEQRENELRQEAEQRENELRQEAEQRDQEVLDMKIRILSGDLDERVGKEFGSVAESISKVSNWKDKHNLYPQNDDVHPAATKSAGMIHSSQKSPVDAHEPVSSPAISHIPFNAPMSTKAPAIIRTQNKTSVGTPQVDAPALLTNVLSPLASTSETQQSSSSNTGCNEVYNQLRPTREQLECRRGMSKSLPNFGGDPKEWAMFISYYNQATELGGFSDVENMMRLQHCLYGKAKEAVAGHLTLPAKVSSVIETLRLLYGRPEIIIDSLTRKIRDAPPPRLEKPDSVVNYAIAVDNLTTTMVASGLSNHLNNPNLLKELVDKLPAMMFAMWVNSSEAQTMVTIETFSRWLYGYGRNISKFAPTPYGHQDTERKVDRSNNSRYQNKLQATNRTVQKTPAQGFTQTEKAYLNKHEEAEQNENKSKSDYSSSCLACGRGCSSLEKCKKFQEMSVFHRLRWVFSRRLCKQCLERHGKTTCAKPKSCGQPNCQYEHHPMLHKAVQTPEVNQPKVTRPVAVQSDATSDTKILGTTFNTHTSTGGSLVNTSILFRIIPVILRNLNKEVRTFAFIDDGSSITLVENNLAEELELNGRNVPLCLKWTAETHRDEQESREVSLCINGTSQHAKQFNLMARTVTKLSLPTQSISMVDFSHKYKYLEGLPIESYQQATPRLLIGLDNHKLGNILRVREGYENEPAAAKCRLGWTLYGPCSSIQERSPNITENVNYHACECLGPQPEENLHQLVKSQFALETLGIGKPETLSESDDDKRARQILENTTKRIGNKFETGLLWKFDEVQLPNSLPMAKRRLESLKTKMTKNPQLAENMNNQILDYVKKGYATKLTTEELQIQHPRVWYLPIFPVVNPNKPAKVRLVWDAAAQVDGISLNSMLLKGPDQLASLLGVLQRFREFPVAISGDIKEMFHQVSITESDRQVQRFLWPNTDNPTQVDVYVMNVMTFGATCSPSSAQFVKNKNALEHQKEHPNAVLAITDNHYVDDLLDSQETPEQALVQAKNVKRIHLQGGFEIRNWRSNCKEVLTALGEHHGGLQKNMDMSPENMSERILGMWWSAESDEFTYSLTSNKSNRLILVGEMRPTKREVLRILMSIFDPLGLLAHLLIYAKILLQELWKSKLEWDEQISDEHFSKWSRWIKCLNRVAEIKIPRCYRPLYRKNYDGVQLHVFVDASECAYAAVAYVRFQDEVGIHCSLLGAKTRVAPLRIVSIPRLELEAAVLGSRWATTIEKNHTIKFTERFFWSDSKTVMSWLKSNQRKYKQFVAFRVGEILDATDLKEWNWLSTGLNVADEATKWPKSRDPDLNHSSRWFCGPEFLYQSKEQWPIEASAELTTEEEIHTVQIHEVVAQPGGMQVERFSNWQHLVNSQANKKAGTVGPLSQEEYLETENTLYKQAQSEGYSTELKILRGNKDRSLYDKRLVPASSPIYRMTPYLDDKGVLRSRGRIDAAEGVPYDMKRPIILPRGHHITRLIIMDYHKKYHHGNHETVVNEIRQKFSISRLRVELSVVRKACQKCKNDRAKALPPEMADLPLARLAIKERAFTHVGVDYFGPMQVRQNRSTVKVWGVLFTCLTVRAVHLELANSLSSDSCIMAIRNFTNRRGMPKNFYSDNGTNFHGANNELRDAFNKLEKNKICEHFTNSTTEWKFNPPAAPHMGGSWERLVQSVKKVLSVIKPARTPTEEQLRSMLTEVENIINSRPLTWQSIENADQEALTPNHFLLGSSSGDQPVAEPIERETLRSGWKAAQLYANQIWKRWISEYLPELTRRSKWNKPVEPLKVGDIVIIVDENSQRSCWPKGIIVKAIMGSGNQVRRAVVRTATGLYERPAVKLAKLDVNSCGVGEQKPEGISAPGGSVNAITSHVNTIFLASNNERL